MITTKSREENFTRKEEGQTVDGNISKAASSTSITPWSRLKDPRIVHVSRAFGGKDRHSKVCTVKGLRDRRVRLSVPTAIQVYDLQERLRLNQPSKVFDWLLNAAKNDIDELPPLQLPPGNCGKNYGIGVSQSDKELGLMSNNGLNWGDSSRLFTPNFSDLGTTMRDKGKGISIEMEDHKHRWNNEKEKQGNVEVHGANASPATFFPRPNHSFIPGLLNNVVHYNSFYRFDPLNFSSPQTEDFLNFNLLPLPPTSWSLSFGSQVLDCPSGRAQSHLPTSYVELDPKQINHYQMLSSSSQNPLPNSRATGGSH